MANSQQPEQPKAKGKEFAIAQDPIWKKQDQEQKRFLRWSHGEDSRKPIANRTNQAIKEQDQEQKRFLRQSQGKDSREPVAIRTDQAIQRARSRALKAVYAKGELMIFVEIPNIPKNRHTPPSIDKLKPTNKPKRSNRSAKPSKKPRRKPTQSRYWLKTQSNSKGL